MLNWKRQQQQPEPELTKRYIKIKRRRETRASTLLELGVEEKANSARLCFVCGKCNRCCCCCRWCCLLHTVLITYTCAPWLLPKTVTVTTTTATTNDHHVNSLRLRISSPHLFGLRWEPAIQMHSSHTLSHTHTDTETDRPKLTLSHLKGSF